MKQPIEIREQTPKIESSKSGTTLICPFCAVPHALLPGKVSECGTTIKVTAIQTVYNAHGHKAKILCLKCGKGGGQFVRHQNSFIHLDDCMPGTKVLAVMPEFSKFAEITYRLPEPVKKLIQKVKGRASALDEIDQEGKKTGKVLGYFFWKNTA